jgi:hypothetical protein
MILNFIFSNINIIILGIWLVFFVLVAIRFFYPVWVRNVSFLKLAGIAVGLNIFYSLFFTWAQYYVWKITDLTKTYIKLPYFLHYVFIHFWLNVFILFLISGGLYLIFKIWKFYRGNFKDQGPELLLVLMLISGFPGILVLVPLGFILSIFLFVVLYAKTVVKRNSSVAITLNIEPSFIIATFLTLLFSRIILHML